MSAIRRNHRISKSPPRLSFEARVGAHVRAIIFTILYYSVLCTRTFYLSNTPRRFIGRGCTQARKLSVRSSTIILSVRSRRFDPHPVGQTRKVRARTHRKYETRITRARNYRESMSLNSDPNRFDLQRVSARIFGENPYPFECAHSAYCA